MIVYRQRMYGRIPKKIISENISKIQEGLDKKAPAGMMGIGMPPVGLPGLGGFGLPQTTKEVYQENLKKIDGFRKKLKDPKSIITKKEKEEAIEAGSKLNRIRYENSPSQYLEIPKNPNPNPNAPIAAGFGIHTSPKAMDEQRLKYLKKKKNPLKRELREIEEIESRLNNFK